ncbi:hypothetical protein LX32DRAFT_330447 [Colletotrichum zoysiae]|uniref:START domain-containing protein n=1 Tax=Colletotrichum zoysiae TaxID=1216348 RepID=A0AAD9M373_9PEZI|nr:hypothetical protein LX32DRAFT_330447 [Colletotrichum zoysiae]
MFHGLLTHALLAALTLASHVDAARVLIGYRVVDEREAAIINRMKRIFRDPDYDVWAEFRGGAQTGLGVYLSGRLDAWHSTSDNWQCYVEADEARLDATPKVWIPKWLPTRPGAKRIELWNSQEGDIQNYVASQLKPGEDKHNALRLSYISLMEPNEQLLIPTSMAQNNALDFYAKCFKTLEEVRQHHSGTVNYDSWTKQRGRKAGRKDP